jgi:hypothetical protein
VFLVLLTRTCTARLSTVGGTGQWSLQHLPQQLGAAPRTIGAQRAYTRAGCMGNAIHGGVMLMCAGCIWATFTELRGALSACTTSASAVAPPCVSWQPATAAATHTSARRRTVS